MIRLQVQLREDQHARLRAEAAKRGVSISALLREAVDRGIGEDEAEQAWQRALAAVGQFRSGRSYVSGEHDRQLDDSFDS